MVPDLETIPLFNGIDAQYLALLRPLFERVSYRVGTIVIEQGADADFLYLIENGKAAITFKPYDGDLITITHVETGGFFGWSALVGSPVYTSSVVAIEGLDVMRMRGSDLRKLCLEHPEAGRTILDRLASSVSGRWKDSHEQIRSMLKNGLNG